MKNPFQKLVLPALMIALVFTYQNCAEEALEDEGSSSSEEEEQVDVFRVTEGEVFTWQIPLEEELENDAVVTWSISSGEYGSADDFDEMSGEVELEEGDSVLEIELEVESDSLIEGTEEFVVTLSSDASELSDEMKMTAEVTVYDEDAIPNITVTGLTVSEGNDFVIGFELAKESERTVRFEWDLSEESAEAGEDYIDDSGEVIFQSGQTYKEILIEVIDDGDTESLETLYLVVSDVEEASFTNYTIELSIADNEGSQVAAGRYHTCAVQDGQAYCWGRNDNGELGDGTTSDQRTARNGVVSGLENDVLAIAAGGYHSCAIQDQALKCWGYNGYGQIGDGRTSNRYAPYKVPELSDQVDYVSLGNHHSCAIRQEKLYCWGYNNQGQLGNNSTSNQSRPIEVMTSDVSMVASGGEHTCAIVDEALYCWGRNSEGQLGDGTTSRKTTPQLVSGLEEDVTYVTAGLYHTCAIHKERVKCWGHNDYGQLGDDRTTNRTAPYYVTSMSSPVAVTALEDSTCALNAAGETFCWGRNTHGQVGVGTSTTREGDLQEVTSLGSAVSSLSAGLYHTVCAQNGNGDVSCWGMNNYGQVGNGSTANSLSPVRVLP